MKGKFAKKMRGKDISRFSLLGKGIPEQKKKRKIFSNKLQLKTYLLQRNRDVRIGVEAYQEIEEKMEDVLLDLIDKAIQIKKERGSKVLSGKDVILANNKIE